MIEPAPRCPACRSHLMLPSYGARIICGECLEPFIVPDSSRGRVAPQPDARANDGAALIPLQSGGAAPDEECSGGRRYLA